MQGNSAVKGLISVGEQIMADLPQDRTKEEPPFTYCGVDVFSSFEIKEGDGRSITQNVASLNIRVHDVINLLYYEH